MRSLAYLFAMVMGAAVYDPALVQKGGDSIWMNLTVTRAQTLRLPLYLTLVMAVLTLITTCRMQETAAMNGRDDSEPEDLWASAVSVGYDKNRLPPLGGTPRARLLFVVTP